MAENTNMTGALGISALKMLAAKVDARLDVLEAALTEVVADKADAADLTDLIGRVETLTGDGDGSITQQIDAAIAEISAGATIEASETNGNIKINGVETTVYRHPDDKTAQDVALRKVGSDAEGHVLGGDVAVKSDITELVGAVTEEEGDLGMMTAADKNKLGGITDGATKVQGNAETANGTILVDGTETTVVRFASDEEVEAALNEVFGKPAEAE